MHWSWLAFAEVVWVVGASLWILSDRRAPASTLAWIVTLAMLPGVGIPVYFFLGPRRLRRRQIRYHGHSRRVAESLRRIEEVEHAPPDLLRQVRLALRLDEAPLGDARRAELYYEGEAAFAAMERVIRGARHHVHLEFYIWDLDETGRRFRDLLVAKAKEGVEVRVLVDAMGAKAKRSFFEPLIAAGGEFQRFNPPRFGLLRSRFLNFRSHRKILVADGDRGFLGGMNISDTQTSGRSRGGRAGKGGEHASPWRDTMLELEGNAVRALQRTFFENWCYACRREPPPPEPYFPLGPPGEVRLQVIRSGPDRAVFPIHEFLFTAIAGADERVWITCPYLVPDEPIYTALRSAAHRGVDVRLLVPREGDSKLVQAAVRSLYEEWLAAGIAVHEYGPAMLHAKTMVVDHELAVVGSANFDNRSFRLNFEIVAALYGAEWADGLAAQFEKDLENARRIAPGDVQKRRRIGRLAQDFARALAIQL